MEAVVSNNFFFSAHFEMSIIRFSIVAAMTTKRGIGLHGGLPWTIKKDMKFFKDLTTTTTVFYFNACKIGS